LLYKTIRKVITKNKNKPSPKHKTSPICSEDTILFIYFIKDDPCIHYNPVTEIPNFYPFMGPVD
jgi:hypothetical protein